MLIQTIIKLNIERREYFLESWAGEFFRMSNCSALNRYKVIANTLMLNGI
jgi:hypothetical protein